MSGERSFKLWLNVRHYSAPIVTLNVSVVLKKLIGNLGSAHALMMNPEEPIKPNSPFGLFLRHMIISFELASFEQLSMFLQVQFLLSR